MKKLLPVVILAVVVLLCSASTASAWVTASITPSKQYTCPQISNYWSPSSPPLLADKTVTYTVTVTTNRPPVSVAINPGDAPPSWFSWLTQTLPFPNTAWTWPLDIKVPLTLGKDAGGVYTITVTAVDSWGSTWTETAELEVQDHDYVTETMVQMDPGATAQFTINENFRNMAVAAKVDKHINFNGTVDYFALNEYLIENAKGNNANFEQESAVFGFTGDHLRGDERFKSCAAMGGTGANIRVNYSVDWMEQRVENLNHHVTGDQKRKTELDTYNTFNGTFLVDARQVVPCSRRVIDYQRFDGNLTVGKHIIYRRP